MITSLAILASIEGLTYDFYARIDRRSGRVWFFVGSSSGDRFGRKSHMQGGCGSFSPTLGPVPSTSLIFVLNCPTSRDLGAEVY